MVVGYGIFSLFKLFDRFISTYLWLYPILYVFWPNTRRKNEENNYNVSINSLNESTRSSKSSSARSIKSISKNGALSLRTESIDCQLLEVDDADYDDANSEDSGDSTKDQVGAPNNTDYLGFVGQGIQIKRIVSMGSASEVSVRSSAEKMGTKHFASVLDRPSIDTQ